MEALNVLLLLVLFLLASVGVMVYILSLETKDLKAILKGIVEDIEQKATLRELIAVQGHINMEKEINNVIVKVEDINTFLKTKGFTVTLVSGLKAQLVEAFKLLEREADKGNPKKHTATPGK